MVNALAAWIVAAIKMTGYTIFLSKLIGANSLFLYFGVFVNLTFQNQARKTPHENSVKKFKVLTKRLESLM
ncbi:hypothetical protein A3765_19475 [Oleiphilus sp. HI0130]|nr:hypothetical protein A3765_19475 [Oleiphilus sp. HI0130]